MRNAAGQLSYRFEFLRLAEFFFEAFAFGNVAGHHEAGGGIAELNGVGGNFHEEDGAILPAMTPRAIGVGRGCGSPGMFEEFRHILRGPNVAQRHAEEFLAGVAVTRDGRLVHGQERERSAVEHPHRLGIGFEEKAVTALRFLQLALRAAAQRDVAEHEHDAGDVPLRVVDGSGAVVDGDAAAVPGDQDGVIGQAHSGALLEYAGGEVGRGLARELVFDTEDFRERETFGGGVGPAGECLRDGIHEVNAAVRRPWQSRRRRCCAR